ncbi:glycosyltransferase family 4 protein [Leifsonia aquatica]|uniref:glycosyltransferase family 4 protein n=1 Tax=Leifsonia aquatica TaxID=144185 RepID=UPI0028B15922|nr:glycosyltransferase family 4 protein [Leifsonia aquatica]
MHAPAEHRPLALVANPSADLYGSDLQMLESVQALVEDGFDVLAVLGAEGPLAERLKDRGADVMIRPFPVLRRADASIGGVVSLGWRGARSIAWLRSLIRGIAPDVVYVNTVTLPWWIVAARQAGVPVVCHVHEAETTDGRLVRFALNAPLLLANRIISISRASTEALTTAIPRLGRTTVPVYNGVTEPPAEPAPVRPHGAPTTLSVVARLSPRKAPDVALEASAILRARGRDVRLELVGTPFEGYEWYEQQLRERADRPDLRGHVSFPGYVSPIWPALERADIVLAPSLREPFGNAVVEAQFARRPVIAAAALGHLESIEDGVTGLLVDPGDPGAMADAVERLLDAPELAQRMADDARAAALERFTLGRYRSEIAAVVRGTARARERRRRSGDARREALVY